MAGHDFVVKARYIIEETLGDRWNGRRRWQPRREIRSEVEPLSVDIQCAIFGALMQRNSIRSTVRTTGVSKDKVKRLIRSLGLKCTSYQRAACWSAPVDSLDFHQVFTLRAKRDTPPGTDRETDSVWTKIAVDRRTGFVPWWLVGPYLVDVSEEFTRNRDVHNTGVSFAAEWFAELGPGLARKVESHAAALGLFFMHYNFAKPCSAIGSTPAIAAGITDHIWTVREIVNLADTMGEG